MSTSSRSVPDFELFCKPLIGLPISHIWRGYGSAIFLEFGTEPRTRRDGSPGNPLGEWTLMIEWSWRIEGKRLIWCGSWSDEERWPRAFNRLLGAKVEAVSLFGRLPKIDLKLTNGIHVVSMMTAEGDPEWGLINRKDNLSVGVRLGRLVVEPSRKYPVVRDAHV